MIRVNLLRQQEKTQTGQTGTVGTFGSLRAGGGLPKGFGQKLIGVIAPIVVVYVFNFVQIKTVDNQIEDLQNEIKSVESQSQVLKPQLDQIEQYKAEKATVQKEIDEIKGLSLGRYKTIKILDTIQTIMPQKAWISTFELKGDTVNLDGSATEDIAISSFIEDLDRSLYFKEISWIDSREAKSETGEIVKNFKLSFKLENL